MQRRGWKLGPHFSFYPPKAELHGEQGQTNCQTIQAVASPAPNGPLHVGAVADGSVLVVHEVLGGLRICSLPAAQDGEYSGTILFHVCKDQGCIRQIEGSPFSIPYTVTLDPTLEVTPPSLTLSAVSGTPIETDLAVELPLHVNAYDVTPSWDGGDWLTVVEKEADSFRLRAASLPAGHYSTALWVETRAPSRQQRIPVDYTVSAPPGGEHGLSVSPAQVTFAAPAGGSSDAVLLEVTEPTWKPSLELVTSYGPDGANWLVATPVPGGYSLRADATGLWSGTYDASLTIRGDRHTIEQQVSVAVTVGPGLIRPADRTLTVGGETVAAELHGAVPVTVESGPAMPWTAITSSRWLVLDTSSGVSGEELRYHVDRDALAAMPNGTSEVAGVRISAASPVVEWVVFTVTLEKALPEIRYVTPAPLLAGRPGRARAFGLGFAALPSVGSRLTIEGLSGVAVTRLGDGELVLDVPTAAAGNHVVRMSNALGLPTSSGTLRLADPVAYGPARFDRPGSKTRLLHDPVGRALYVLNGDRREVERLAFADGAWTSSMRAIAALRDVALSPDGATLIAVSDYADLRLLDPVTLEDRAREGQLYGMWDLAVTGDGKVWMATGADIPHRWHDYVTFDLALRTFHFLGVQDLGSAYASFHGGTYSSSSRDGERLVVCPSDDLSPTPDMLLRTTSTGAFRAVDAPSMDSCQPLSQSDDGARMVLTGDFGPSVHDAELHRLGWLPQPAGTYRFTGGAVLSPDGTRAYVLTYAERYWDPLAPRTRVWVYDTSSSIPSGENLPVLGSFELEDGPHCAAGNVDCQVSWPLLAISPDGGTLFISDSRAVVVVPIPELDTSGATSPAPPETPQVLGTRAWNP